MSSPSDLSIISMQESKAASSSFEKGEVGPLSESPSRLRKTVCRVSGAAKLSIRAKCLVSRAQCLARHGKINSTSDSAQLMAKSWQETNDTFNIIQGLFQLRPALRHSFLCAVLQGLAEFEDDIQG